MNKLVMMSIGVLLVCPSLLGSEKAYPMADVSWWVESIDWSAATGFSLKLREKDGYHPLPMVLKENESRKWANGGETLRIAQGSLYTLTNCRGRSHELRAVAPTGIVQFVGQAIPLSDVVEALTIELKERVSRDGKIARKKYVVLSNGRFLEVANMTFKEAIFPIALHDKSEESRSKESDVRDVALFNRLRVEEEKAQALAALEMRAKETSSNLNTTNEFCYFSLQSDTADKIRSMTKDGKLGPTLTSLLQSHSLTQWKSEKKAAFYLDKEGLHVVHITLHYSDGNGRRVAFYNTGEVATIIDEYPVAKWKDIYCFEKTGELRWMVQESRGKVVRFWWVDGKESKERFDYDAAQKLLFEIGQTVDKID